MFAESTFVQFPVFALIWVFDLDLNHTLLCSLMCLRKTLKMILKLKDTRNKVRSQIKTRNSCEFLDSFLKARLKKTQHRLN